MTTMMMASTSTMTKTKTITRTNLIKYQKMMTVVWKHMMIVIMITHLKITTKIIITKKMKKMMIITLRNLKMMIKIQIVLINPYPVSMA